MIKDPYLPLPLPEDGEHAIPEKIIIFLFVSCFIYFVFNLFDIIIIMIVTCYFIYNSNPIYNFFEQIFKFIYNFSKVLVLCTCFQVNFCFMVNLFNENF